MTVTKFCRLRFQTTIFFVVWEHWITHAVSISLKKWYNEKVCINVVVFIWCLAVHYCQWDAFAKTGRWDLGHPSLYHPSKMIYLYRLISRFSLLHLSPDFHLLYSNFNSSRHWAECSRVLGYFMVVKCRLQGSKR